MTIYVGNLPKNATEEALRQAFEQYGEVTEIKLIKDNYTGELRGFGFVEMPAQNEAQAAISALNGADYVGRKLTVNEARKPQERRGGGGRRPGGFRGGRSRSY